jgi:hypothetical protein
MLFFFCSPQETLDGFHSLQIKTVGDLARSTVAQIETYPIPVPKLLTAQKALALFQAQSVNAKNDELSPPAASTSEQIICTYSSSKQKIDTSIVFFFRFSN